MTLPAAGAPHVYPAPSASQQDSPFEALARLIVGLMLQSITGNETQFDMETLGANGTNLGVSCRPASRIGKWQCDVEVFYDVLVPKEAKFYPFGTTAEHPHTLTMRIIASDTHTAYYRITNPSGTVLKTFGISRS